MARPDRAPNEAPEPQKLERLAEWAASRRFTDIRPEDLPYLKPLVPDTVGCALGALGHGPSPGGCRNALGLHDRKGANAIAMYTGATNTLWVISTGRLSSWKGFASAQAAMSCMHRVLLASRGLTRPLNRMEGPGGC